MAYFRVLLQKRLDAFRLVGLLVSIGMFLPIVINEHLRFTYVSTLAHWRIGAPNSSIHILST